MKYYALIKDTEIIGTGNCHCQSEDCICIEITEEQYNLLQEKGNNYLIYENGEIIVNPNYEEEQQRKKDMLSLTRGDVFSALIQARMIDEATLRAQIEDKMPETTIKEKKAKMLALNALSNALNFHRGHDLVNEIGNELGISSENLNLFFETNDYHYLQEQPEPIEGQLVKINILSFTPINFTYKSILKEEYFKNKEMQEHVKFGLYGGELKKNNVSLEHIKPHCKGGRNELYNFALATKKK